MKHLAFILLSLVTFFAHSQELTVINFELVNGQPQTTDEIVNLKLPIEFRFTDKFRNKTIEIINIDDKTIALKGIKFGGSDFTITEGIFIVTIDNDGKVNPEMTGDKKIESDKFKIKIGNSNPITITLDTTQPTQKNDNNDDYQPGYIYYDAIKLSNETDPHNINKILEAYGVKSDNIDNNEYLNEFFKEEIKKPTPKGGLPLLGNLGNTDVTYFAAGLARFLAERTKEELNEAFFRKMKKQLHAYPELTTVFPKTSSFLDIIETYSYASVIQVLKEAFETDIQNLPENLYNVKSLTSAKCNSSILKESTLIECQYRMDKLEAFFDTQDGRWVGLGMFTVKEAVQSSNPADLLKSITESGELTGIKAFSKTNSKYTDYNVASSIELGNFLSQSLMSKEDNQIWINSKELNALYKNQKTIKIYLGLLLAKEQKGDVKIDFYKSDNTTLITFGKILKEAYKTYTVLEPQIGSLIKNSHTAFSSANNAVKKMIAATDKSVEVDPQALYDYYRTFTASLKPIAHNELLNTITGRTNIGAKYDTIEQYLNPSVDIAYHIATKKYSAALYDVVLLLNNTNNPVFEKPVAKSFIKYGTLISTVANAQSSDEVKKAIEASVLPVGSSAIKRNSAWSISVNGYVGVFYGKAHGTIQDTLRNSSTNKLDTITKSVSYRTFGLYAPVGLSFNRGFKSGWGVSLSAQILDLGALVNFYLTEGDKASLPTDFKVKLSDILSPGVQLALNIPKTPLSIIGGFQYVPALNDSDQISTGILSPIAWRGQIGIVVDIPLYNLKVWDFKE